MAELDAEQEMTRTDVATYLREFADKLDEQGNRAETDGQAGAETSSTDTTREDDSGTESATREIGADASETNDDGTNEPGDGDRATTDRATTDRAKSTHGERITFMVGNESATINPPTTVQFQMAVDSDSTMLESGARETVEFALHWDTENVTDDDTLDIQ